MDDEFYMKEALRLARKGQGWVSPNPMVGALVTRGGKIVGRGYHRRYGGPHAEVNALKSVKTGPKGSTLYVTLEPCSHHGKTLPCVDLIIKDQISRVVIGTVDPNPLVGGKGIEALRDHGIQLTVGVMEQQCRELNAPFFKYFEKGLPYVTLKMAQSLDGRIATKTGNSRWISSPESLRLVHRYRAIHEAIMVGLDTVLRDDPSLTVRLVKGKNPLRLILDSQLRTPLKSKVLSDGHASRTMIVTTDHADRQKIERVEALGARILSVEANHEGRVDLTAALQRLAGEGITSILLEGGARLGTSFMKAGLVDKLVVIIAPKIIGKGIEALEDLGISEIDQALSLSIERIQRVGKDLVVVAKMGSDRHSQ